MKRLTDFILESASNEDNVYAVYFGDGILDTYFNEEKDAEARKDELNKEVETNKCVVKKEPRSNFEEPQQ